MRISKDRFAEIIAEKSALEKDESIRFLNALTEEIRASVQQNGSYTLKGFGSFRLSDSGDFIFEEDDILSLELNFEYAGLKPIEIAPAVNPPSEEDLQDEFTEEESAYSDLEDPIENEDDELQSEAFMHPDLRVTDDDLDEIEADEEEGFIKEEDEKISSIFGVDQLEEEEFERPESDEKAAFEKFRNQQKKERSKNTRSVLVTVLVAIAIGLVLWFFVLQPYLQGPPAEADMVAENPLVEESTPPQPMQEETSDEMPAENQTNPADVFPDEQEALSNVVENSSLDESEVEDVIDEVYEASDDQEAANDIAASLNDEVENTSELFALKGGEVSRIENSTTIVLHSLNSQRSAEQVAEGLKKEGYRTVTFKATLPDGRTFWRVGIGQFANFADAASIRENLPPPYNERSFVAKITF